MSPFIKPVLDVRDSPRVILVTGATGFLGGHLVSTLLEQGNKVRATGRNLKAGLELSARGADFVPVDLRDRGPTLGACRGAWAVVHAGALSSAWGRYRDFHETNVTGTENVIAGCLAHGVDRLVYISSPSVISCHAVQCGLRESHPLPETFVSDYSKTKALAETRVQAARDSGLKTVILRPKAIYGPGDQAIFPRIVEAVSKGRFPILGDGNTVTDVTHVEDVVQAILLALESEKAVGKIYHITGGQEVNLLEVVRLIIDRMGYPPLKRRIPVERAMLVAGMVEDTWRRLRLKGEPPLTRYKVSIMGYSQTYDISAAKRDLGYEPRVTWQEGVTRFLDSLDQGESDIPSPPEAPPEPGTEIAPVAVKLKLFQAGVTEARERVFGLSKSWKHVNVPALFGWIQHPVHGCILFDTGYSTHFFEATRAFPEKLYAFATPVKIRHEENAAPQLKKKGVEPEDVDWIIISHFDPDHIGGLKDFPNARIICSWRAWEEAAGKRGLKALTSRLLPGLLPEDLSARLLILPDPFGPAIGPFERSLDLFGDRSIRLVLLPGHAPGMLGAFVETGSAQSFFLCADAIWSMNTVEKKGAGTGVHRLIAKDRSEQDECYRKLIQLHEQLPGVKIVPSHCPATAAELL